MEVLYSVSATATGGRDGRVSSADGVLDLEVRTPKELGGPGGDYANPEQLFAAGYAACFTSALNLAARRKGLRTGTIRTTVTVGIGRNARQGFELTVRIDASIPEVSKAEADELLKMAEGICPYSNATRGNIRTEAHADTH